MKRLKINKNFVFFGLILLLILTYFRENFLLSINATIASQEFDRSYKYWMSDFFREQPIDQLQYWKWGLTFFFSGLMSLVTLISIHIWFKVTEYLKISLVFYFVTFVFVFVLAIAGYFVGAFDMVYPLLRKILGIIQSPLPFFFFFVLFYWKEKTDSNH